MEARLREALQSNSVEQDIFSILKGGLNEVRSGTEVDLQESLQELGVTVEAFIILDVDAGDEIEQVVRDEATAAKQKEIASKEQESELISQETKRLSAEIEALTVVIEADAQAEAQRILNSVTASAIYTMYEGQFLDDLGILDDALKLEFELREEDFLTFQLFTSSTSPRIIRKKKNGWMFLTLGSILFAALFYSFGNIPLAVCMAFFAVTTALFYPMYFKWRYKKHYQNFCRKRTYCKVQWR